jgi:deoxyribonuclease-4
MILGVHVTKASHVLDDKQTADDLSSAITRDIEALNINAAQVFTYGPQFLTPNKINFEAVKEATKDIDLTVHSAYMTTGIWKVSKENQEQKKSKNKLDLFKAQLISCKKIGAWGMVIHINKLDPEIIADTMHVLKPLAKRSGIKIILEMVAIKAHPDKTYETPEKIDNLTTLIGAKESWWGWCVDTSHIWGAGIDVKSYQNMKNWLDRITYKKKILMFHLNGSYADRGSGKDKHAIPFAKEDNIWSKVPPKESGVRAVVEFSLEHNCTMICEINRGTEKDAKKALETILELGR